MRVKLELTSNGLLTAWRCVKTVLDHNIPENSTDVGLLMESMGDLAKAKDDLTASQNLAQDNSELDIDNPKPPRETHEFFLNKDKVEAIWHCSRIVLDNKLYPDPLEAPEEMKKIIELAETLAKKLDEANQRKSKLKLVDSSGD